MEHISFVQSQGLARLVLHPTASAWRACPTLSTQFTIPSGTAIQLHPGQEWDLAGGAGL